jgi:RNA polymerase sigma-70 factor (ECF subfamily)
MPDSLQVRALLNRWRGGDEEAARQLFQLYVDRLISLARQRISQRLASRVDPEDVVQSVFRTFFHRMKDGQFHFEEEDDLCKLLARITVHKTFRQVAFHRAAKRDMNLEAGHGGDASQDQLLSLLDRGPTPEAANAFLDQLEHFLSRQRPEDRRIIELRMQGYKDVEIAKMLNISDRKIRRLMERVRGQAEQDGIGPGGLADAPPA